MAINERLVHTASAAAAGTGNQEEGLILHLDANDVDSYDGDGDVWYDIHDHEYTPATKVSEHFNTVTYTGDASTRSITGVGFQPDLVWVKNRDGAYFHGLIDSVRGTAKVLYSNDSGIDSNSYTQQLTSFDSDGFSLGDNSDSGNYVNLSGDDYVAWCFKAGGAPTASNPIFVDGTGYATLSAAGLDDSTNTNYTSLELSVNTDLGFSIVTANAPINPATARLPHGLGQEPEMVIHKATGQAYDWAVWHKDLPDKNYRLRLNENAAANSYSNVNGGYFTGVNSTDVMYLQDSSDRDQIYYSFVSKRGVSKVGSYIGDGTTSNKIYTGFEPAFLMIKGTDQTSNWIILDNKRDTSNPNSARLDADSNGAEYTGENLVDFNRDGFTLVTSSASKNGNNNNFIYYAVAKDTNETSLIPDTDLELHLDPTSYSGSGTTWTADTGSNATVVASRYDEELGDSFDISTDGESTIQIASGHPLNDNSFTLEFWFNWKSTPSAANRFIYESSGGWNFFYYSGLGWRINNPDVATGYFSNGNFITVGQWYHCVIAQDSSNCKIYFDGELVKTQSVTSGTRSLGAFNFGTTYITADKPKCDIGQIRMYSSALTQDQIRQNYNFTKNNYPNGNDGTISGATWNAEGYFDFERSSSNNVTISDSSSLDISGDITLSAWINEESVADYGRLFWKSGAYSLYRGTNGWNFLLGSTSLVHNSDIPSTGTWYHIAATYDGSNQKLYINGALVDTESMTGSVPTNNNPLYIAGVDANRFFDGKIGAAKIYSRALTASELLADYNATKSTYGL